MKPKIQKLTFEGDYIGYPVGNHLEEAIEFVLKSVNKFNTIKKFKGKDINLWCRGSSGAILAALFGAKIIGVSIKICHVKKQGETSHNSSVYPLDNAINVIIDDFCETGITLNSIYEELSTNDNKKVHCLVIGTTNLTKKHRRIPRLLKFLPQVIITNK